MQTAFRVRRKTLIVVLAGSAHRALHPCHVTLSIGLAATDGSSIYLPA